MPEEIAEVEKDEDWLQKKSCSEAEMLPTPTHKKTAVS